MSEKNGKLAGKIIIQASVFNRSNLLVGSGIGEVLDFELIRENGQVFIPASGFVGMLRKYFNKWVDISKVDELKKNARFFWGNERGEDSNLTQSHLIIDDLICLTPNPKIVDRDGVAISHQNGRALHHSKYDYELIEPDAEFLLNAEVTIREGNSFDKNIFLQFVNFIVSEGKAGKYKQGAFTSHGFGELEWKYVKVYHFEFPNDADVWFDYCDGGQINKSCFAFTEPHNLPEPEKKIKTAIITGTFSIKNSLIIGASDDSLLENSLDKTHIKNSAGIPLLTSKSIRGAIRHRALKILKTIGNNEMADEIVENLFGMVYKEDTKNKKGRIVTKETKIEGADSKQIQPRIKIDRFTGGTMNSALLSAQPLWHKDETFTLTFEIEDYEPHEIAIMLLVMKDLMNEDLPIGGEKAIGRGVLTGTKLTVNRSDGNYFQLDVQNGSLIMNENSKIELVEFEKWIGKLKN